MCGPYSSSRPSPRGRVSFFVSNSNEEELSRRCWIFYRKLNKFLVIGYKYNPKILRKLILLVLLVDVDEDLLLMLYLYYFRIYISIFISTSYTKINNNKSRLPIWPPHVFIKIQNQITNQQEIPMLFCFWSRRAFSSFEEITNFIRIFSFLRIQIFIVHRYMISWTFINICWYEYRIRKRSTDITTLEVTIKQLWMVHAKPQYHIYGIKNLTFLFNTFRTISITKRPPNENGTFISIHILICLPDLARART